MGLKHILSAVACGSVLLSSTASAEMYWSNFSLSYLNGKKYEVGDAKRQVLTVEHASGHNWGDNFFFLDHTTTEHDNVDNYMELSPRLSLSYLSGSKLSAGFIKDVLLASTWEGGSSFNNYLYGVGLSLAIPGFKYFDMNVYKVSNDHIENDEQLSFDWGLPFTIGGAEFLYDGFLDWSSSAEDHAAEMNFTSQLKWNAGKLIDTKAPVYVGVEYAYWHNKYGIKDVDEKCPSLLIKAHF